MFNFTPFLRTKKLRFITAIGLIAFMGSLTRTAAAQTPVSYWSGDGNALDSIGGNNGTLSGGVSYASAAVNQGFSFNGTNGVVRVGDPNNLKITGSLTISAYIRVDSFNSNNPDGESFIVFRGDNRSGRDPYTLEVLRTGDIVFRIDDANDNQSRVSTNLSTKITPGQFVFVSAALDAVTGIQTLSLDNVVVAQTTTTIRPYGDLTAGQMPGVSIGNSTDPTSYNAPFNGVIDEVKIYNQAVVVPESQTIALLAIGLTSLGCFRRRIKR